MFYEPAHETRAPSVRRAMSITGCLNLERQHGPPDGGRTFLARIL